MAIGGGEGSEMWQPLGAVSYTHLDVYKRQLEENRINIERQLTMQATGYLDNMAASTEQVVSLSLIHIWEIFRL